MPLGVQPVSSFQGPGRVLRRGLLLRERILELARWMSQLKQVSHLLYTKGCLHTNASLVPKPNPHAGKRVWCTSSDFLRLMTWQFCAPIRFTACDFYVTAHQRRKCGRTVFACVRQCVAMPIINIILHPASPRNRLKYARPFSLCGD